MPIVSDFITVIGNDHVLITDVEQDFPFGTGGREGNRNAVIFIMVRNLRETLPVKINGKHIGDLTAYDPSWDFQDAWFTQILTFPGSYLKVQGNNELELESSTTDNYFVKNVHCFFHQNA
ncbi:hypothetical protein SAMN05421766_103377 [Zobellia uliginosa]|uniref:Galectin n=1 Tax=Zobellia uliginosa TaxID=143224 RepID=A0ABY1KRD8_9FLAO|nr:hypothetical protein [Zobellia uliginosa]SIS68590.1 hypothetical protein SAMN05421766_103377 [Zobellia uliginosa]